MSDCSFKHFRYQHPVGQGGFHTAFLMVGKDMIRYVYDCGSVNTKPLKDEIRAYAERPQYLDHEAAKMGIDYMFLSHFHADHINGVIDLQKAAPIKRIYIPYISDNEKLDLFIEAIATGKTNDDYIRCLRDPATFFRNLGIDQAFVVRGNEEGGWEPDGETTTPGPGTPFEGITPIDPDDGVSTKADTNIINITAKTPVTFTNKRGNLRLNWVLWPFVADHAASSSLFLDALKKAGLFASPEQALKELSNPSVVATYTQGPHADRIKKCYKAVVDTNQINRTSMCLYSGPFQNGHGYTQYALTHPKLEAWPIYFFYGMRHSPNHQKVGWIGTGDAELTHSGHYHKFINHYKSILQFVTTMTVPHHGSHKNFTLDLLNHSNHFVICAGRNNPHRHPDMAVLSALIESETSYSIVSETRNTMIMEFCSNA